MKHQRFLSTLFIPLAFLGPGRIQAAEQIESVHLRALSLEHPAGDLYLGRDEAAIPIPAAVYRLSPAVPVPADAPLRFYRKQSVGNEIGWDFVGEINRNTHAGSVFTVFFAPRRADLTAGTHLYIYADDAAELATHHMRVINLSGQPLRAREQEDVRLLPESVPVYYRFDLSEEIGEIRSRPFLTFERMNEAGEWVVFTRGPLLRHAGERVTILIVNSTVLQAALQISDAQGQPTTPTASLNIVSWRHPPPPTEASP